MNFNSSNGKNAERVSYNQQDEYGIITYNYFLNYSTNITIDNYSVYGISSSYTSNSNIYNHFHNTTLLFGNLRLLEDISGNLYKLYQSIPSCTIWYCISRENGGGKDASTVSHRWQLDYGGVLYNHKLNYDNNWNIYNGVDGGAYQSYLDSSNVLHWNFHNTTLFFNNLKSLENISKSIYF